MQWRMLARRCPSGSMTLVGDPGQASKPGAVASWDDVLVAPPHAQRDPLRLAEHQLPHPGRGDGGRVPAPRGRRADGRAVTVGAQHGRVPAVRRRAEQRRPRRDRPPRRRAPRSRRTGAVAVIAPPALHAGDRRVARRRRRGVDRRPTRSTRPIAVLDPTSAKGLEFDHVIVVEPSHARERRPGRASAALRHDHAHDQDAHVVHAEALPEGLTPRRD